MIKSKTEAVNRVPRVGYCNKRAVTYFFSLICEVHHVRSSPVPPQTKAIFTYFQFGAFRDPDLEALTDFAALPESGLEITESVDMLRFIESGRSA